MVDYPDFYEHVERTPIQPSTDQMYGVVASGVRTVSGYGTDYFVYNIPNDGYSYVIDTVFLIWDARGMILSGVEYALDQVTPSWYALANRYADMSIDYVLSRQGAFWLTYPNAIRIAFMNDNGITRHWSTFINEYKYIIQ